MKHILLLSYLIYIASHIQTKNRSYLSISVMFNATKDECCIILSNQVRSEWEKEKLSNCSVT